MDFKMSETKICVRKSLTKVGQSLLEKSMKKHLETKRESGGTTTPLTMGWSRLGVKSLELAQVSENL